VYLEIRGSDRERWRLRAERKPAILCASLAKKSSDLNGFPLGRVLVRLWFRDRELESLFENFAFPRRIAQEFF
jgi:hypothetical protein